VGRVATLVGVAAALGLAACAGSGSASQPSASSGPYVVTAIDYHFHDAHPSAPIPLDRAVQFSNQGSQRHNVTIEGTDYSRTFGPGRRITIDPIGSLLTEPGRYPFYCKLHADRGMSGVLVLTDPGDK
jgi:plastocyanin